MNNVPKTNVFGTLKLDSLFWDTFFRQKAPQLSRTSILSNMNLYYLLFNQFSSILITIHLLYWKFITCEHIIE